MALMVHKYVCMLQKCTTRLIGKAEFSVLQNLDLFKGRIPVLTGNKILVLWGISSEASESR